MFFNGFNNYMRELFLKDIDKHNILAWIIYNTNYNPKGYKELKLHQCYITNSVVAKDTKINSSKVQRNLKKLENEGYFSYFIKSNSGKKPSIIDVNFSIWNDRVYNAVDDMVNDTVINVGNNNFEVYCDMDSNIDSDIVSDISSKKISKKEIDSASNEALWKLYPNKRNKARAMKNIPNLISKYGYEQMKNCIHRYIEYVEDERKNGFGDLKYQVGSTFFYGTYIDYLDENYQDQQIIEQPKTKYDEYGYEII